MIPISVFQNAGRKHGTEPILLEHERHRRNRKPFQTTPPSPNTNRSSENLKTSFTRFAAPKQSFYSGLNLNQDKATKPQTVQIVRQGEATPYWFKFNPLYRRQLGKTAPFE